MDIELLRKKLEFNPITSSQLLNSCSVMDLSVRNSAAFNDPRYFPFYYSLGRQVFPKRVVQFGGQLGLVGASFLQGCKTVEEWIVVDDNPVSMIAKNIGKTCKVYEEIPKVDGRIGMGLLTEEKPDRMQFLWDLLEPQGLLVVDYIFSGAVRGPFDVFCRVVNREPIVFNTRYGMGILTR